MNSKECYISVDIETTGPVPGLYSMFEIGAACVHDPKVTFHLDLKLLPRTRFGQEALDAIEQTREALLKPKRGVRPKKAMEDLAAWVNKVAGERTPVFVANNAPFDWMFVAWYFAHFGINNPFGHSALDMKAHFMGLTRCSWKEATLAKMAQYADVAFGKLPHRALDDAIIQGEIFRGLLRKAGHCPRCGSSSASRELREYSMIWHDGKIHCSHCGAFVRNWDAG